MQSAGIAIYGADMAIIIVVIEYKVMCFIVQA